MGGEVGLQPGVAGDMGQDAQLLLRVVGAEQEVARCRHEGAADASAERGPDRDVLEVRIGARQPPGGGHRLGVGGVHAAPLVGQERKRVDVGGLELRDLAVFEDEVDHLVLVTQLLEDRCVGREPGPRPLRGRKLQLMEQDLLELLG